MVEWLICCLAKFAVHPKGQTANRPFSRAELKAKTIRGLSKRETKEKKKEGKRKKGGLKM